MLVVSVPDNYRGELLVVSVVELLVVSVVELLHPFFSTGIHKGFCDLWELLFITAILMITSQKSQ